MAIEDEKLALKRKFFGYVHPLNTIINHEDEKESWIEQMKYLVLDFKTLLNLPFNEFWSTVVFNKEATFGLYTFLLDAAPPYMMDKFPQDDDLLNIYKEIDYFVYLLFIRLTTSSENEDNYMSPHYMWGLLCNNNIINIPMLFDICAIYSESYKKELEMIFKELFTCQKLYTDNLKDFIQITIKYLDEFQDKIELDLQYDNHLYKSDKTTSEIEEENICTTIEDIILFLLDTSYSISNFLEIYSAASCILYEEKLHLKIASFYHNIIPLICKKIVHMNKLEQFHEKLHSSRLLFIEIVRQCLIHLTNQVVNKKESGNLVDEYFEVITELLGYSEFINDYNNVYNLSEDIKKIQNCNTEIDSTRFDYLLKSIELIDISNNALEEKELHEKQLEVQIHNKNLENAKLQSLISDVKELLPHLGNGFIQKCLEYYDMDTEKVINMVLENNLPPELTRYDFNLCTESEYDNNASGYDQCAKENKKLKTLKAVLDDKSFRNEMRPIYEKYNFTEVTCAELESYYDDEYDDTYDEVEYVKPEPVDENEKRRPDVIPRVLTEKKVFTECLEEDISDSEPPPQPLGDFQPFCENPEVVRARQARIYAAKRSNKTNQNKSKVSGTSATSTGSSTDLDRQRKNENKAFHGNHNRRNAARSKQQRGMF